MRFEGRIWKFGDNIDTDVIAPGKHLFLPLDKLATYTLAVHDPRFAKEVKKGDLLVGGRNFGCGSSREQAPRVLAHLGIGCVVAESFARIFYRNCIAIGLPVIAVPGIIAATEPGDTVTVDLSTGDATVARTGVHLAGRALPDRMRAVLAEGGILPALQRIAQRTVE